MGALEVIAGITAVAFLIKVLILLFYPSFTLGVSERLIRNSSLLFIIYSVCIVIVGYFLFAHLSVIHIMASILFFSLIFKLSLLQYPTSVRMLHREFIRKPFWIMIVLFVLLSLWVLVELFA